MKTFITSYKNNKKNDFKLFDDNTFEVNIPDNKTYNFSFDSFKKKGFIDGILDGIYKKFPYGNSKLTTPSNSIFFEKPHYSFNSISPMAFNLEWNKAASKLTSYLEYFGNPTYDFLIGDLPVKVFGNYIQIGYDIIPTFTTSGYFNKFESKKLIKLYEVVTTINEIEIEIAA